MGTTAAAAVGFAHIGKSVSIKGELSGSEDIYVDGEVDGSIQLSGNSLTIGPNGRVHANVSAKSVTVGGSLEGNIQATERTELRKTAVVNGDVQTLYESLVFAAHYNPTSVPDASLPGRCLGLRTRVRGCARSCNRWLTGSRYFQLPLEIRALLDGDSLGLHISVDHRGFAQLRPLGGLNVALEGTSHRDTLGRDIGMHPPIGTYCQAIPA